MKDQNSKIDDHEKRIVKIEERIASIERGLFSGDKQKPHHKQLSIKEFLLTVQPQDDTQRTLAVGYFIENYLGAAPFNAKDLGDGFRNAKETSPSNINDRVNKNIDRGYVMIVKEKKDGKKAWILTNTGEQFINQLLSEYESRGNQ